MESSATNTAPPLFRRHVRRPRLTDLLDQSSAQAILLNAPAGYGKTTLAAEWLHARPNVAWYRASPSSADVAAISVGIARAVRPLIPRAGERLEKRVVLGDAPENSVRALAELLAEDLTQWAEDAWLVIDDYHFLMESPSAEDFIDWLLTLSPLKLLVATRRRPAWASARRVLYGEITEITRDVLAMRKDEAAALLAIHSTEAVLRLLDSARGWPAVIGLAAISASCDLPAADASDALFRYFAEEVLRRQPQDVQDFMLTSSVPPRIGKPSTEALPDRTKRMALERLVDEGLLHHFDGHLQFHPLVRRFLRHKLELEQPELARALTNRAIAAAEENDHWEEAFELARDVDIGWASEIVARAANVLLGQGRIETLEKWITTCGSAALSNEGVTLARAELRNRQGHPSEARALALGLVSRLPETADEVPRAWSVAGQAARSLCNFSEALEYETTARSLAQSRDQEFSAAWGSFLSAAELERNDLSLFLDELERSSSDDIDGQLRLAAARIQFAEHHGSLADAWESVKPLIPRIDDAHDPLARSNALANFAYLQVLRGEFDAAHELACRALDFCTSLRLDFAVGYCLVRRGRAELGLGRLKQARITLSQLEPIVTTSEDPYLHLERALLRLRLTLLTDGTSPKANLIGRFPKERLPRSPYGEYIALCAVSEAVHGSVEAAGQHASEARRLTASLGGQYFARLAELICHHSRSDQAESSIVPTCDLIHEAGRAHFFEGIVIAYRAYPSLVPLLLEDATTTGPLLEHAMQRARDHSLARRFGLMKHGADRTSSSDALTPREHEVFALLAAGFSNAEIAKRLFISPSTAKVHTHRVLTKLGVRTRTQAALRWHDSTPVAD
jgi:ATP/maltotriose-dependent transcriptional regulator MalT